MYLCLAVATLRPTHAAPQPPETDLGDALEPVLQRLRQGSRPAVAEYLVQVPEPERLALLKQLLKLEVEYRQKAGETPTAEDYQPRLPQYGQQLQQFFAAWQGEGDTLLQGSGKSWL